MQNSNQIKQNVQHIRGNITKRIWTETQAMEYLREEHWINHTKEILIDFERNISQQMKQFGWDGNEDEHSVQWCKRIR